MKISNTTFEDDVVDLDNNEFRNCHFKRCRLRFSAQGGVSLVGCVFEGVQWEFGGAAADTLAFLENLVNQDPRHGALLLAYTFPSIKPWLKDELLAMMATPKPTSPPTNDGTQ